MSRRVRIEPPPGGWPWQQPGHRFFEPGFPPGYVPHLANNLLLTLKQRKAIDEAEGKVVDEPKY